MLEEALKVKRKRGSKRRSRLIDCITKNPGITLYELAKKLKWSRGLIHYHLQELLHRKLIIQKPEELINGRIQKPYIIRD